MKITNIKAKGDNILAISMDKGERKTAGGIVIPDDNGKEHGIRPRWCQVLSVGPRSELIDDVHPGDWILVAHGRWTHGIEADEVGIIWRIDPNGILLHSNDRPADV